MGARAERWGRQPWRAGRARISRDHLEEPVRGWSLVTGQQVGRTRSSAGPGVSTVGGAGERRLGRGPRPEDLQGEGRDPNASPLPSH